MVIADKLAAALTELAPDDRKIVEDALAERVRWLARQRRLDQRDEAIREFARRYVAEFDGRKQAKKISKEYLELAALSVDTRNTIGSRRRAELIRILELNKLRPLGDSQVRNILFADRAGRWPKISGGN